MQHGHTATIERLLIDRRSARPGRAGDDSHLPYRRAQPQPHVPGAVSYTHLDVYKRQFVICFIKPNRL